MALLRVYGNAIGQMISLEVTCLSSGAWECIKKANKTLEDITEEAVFIKKALSALLSALLLERLSHVPANSLITELKTDLILACSAEDRSREVLNDFEKIVRSSRSSTGVSNTFIGILFLLMAIQVFSTYMLHLEESGNGQKLDGGKVMETMRFLLFLFTSKFPHFNFLGALQDIAGMELIQSIILSHLCL